MLKVRAEWRAKCMTVNNTTATEGRRHLNSMSGKVDLASNPTNPKAGSIPPQPPNAIKDLFIHQNFVKEAKQ